MNQLLENLINNVYLFDSVSYHYARGLFNHDIVFNYKYFSEFIFPKKSNIPTEAFFLINIAHELLHQKLI